MLSRLPPHPGHVNLHTGLHHWERSADLWSRGPNCSSAATRQGTPITPLQPGRRPHPVGSAAWAPGPANSPTCCRWRKRTLTTLPVPPWAPTPVPAQTSSSHPITICPSSPLWRQCIPRGGRWVAELNRQAAIITTVVRGRGHYRLKALRAGGGGSLGALGPTGLENLNSTHTVHKHATSENGSIHHSLSENQASLLTNGRQVGEPLATSPSEGSDGGSSGSRKPFPLPPSVASRAASHGAQRRCASRDNLKLAAAAAAERETKRCSYPLNSVCIAVPGPAPAPNGTLKNSGGLEPPEQDTSGTDQSQSSVGMKSGLWKSETTVWIGLLCWPFMPDSLQVTLCTVPVLFPWLAKVGRSQHFSI